MHYVNDNTNLVLYVWDTRKVIAIMSVDKIMHSLTSRESMKILANSGNVADDSKEPLDFSAIFDIVPPELNILTLDIKPCPIALTNNTKLASKPELAVQELGQLLLNGKEVGIFNDDKLYIHEKIDEEHYNTICIKQGLKYPEMYDYILLNYPAILKYNLFEIER